MSTLLPPGKRVVVHEFGETPVEAIGKFMTLADMAAQDPATLKPDEALVSIRSAAVAWVDLLMTSGQYQHMATPPYCPGMEYSGVVAAAGSAVDPNELLRERIETIGVVTRPGDRGQQGLLRFVRALQAPQRTSQPQSL